jgi:hypothetical protein
MSLDQLEEVLYPIAEEGTVPPESRHEAIARCAYFLAQERDFAPGHELEDWLAAEEQVKAGIWVAPATRSSASSAGQI